MRIIIITIMTLLTIGCAKYNTLESIEAKYGKVESITPIMVQLNTSTHEVQVIQKNGMYQFLSAKRK